MSRDGLYRLLGASSFALLPLGAVTVLPFTEDARVLLSWAILVASTVLAWRGQRDAVVRALATWCVTLLALGRLPIGFTAGGVVITLVLVVAAIAPRPDARDLPKRRRIIALGLVVLAAWMVVAPPDAVLDGDGPAHIGGILDSWAAGQWDPPDMAKAETDVVRTDPRFGALHGLYAAMATWSGASAASVFARAVIVWVPLGFLGFVAWMRAWGVAAPWAVGLSLLMILAGAGGRGFALWRAAFPGDAAVLTASFVMASLTTWLRAERPKILPVSASLLSAASVAIHPFAWWIVMVATGVAVPFAAILREHRGQITRLIRFGVVTGVLGGLVVLPRWLGRGDSTAGIHQVATDVILFGDGRFVVDPLALAHWGGWGALCAAPLLLIVPRSWWRQPAAPLAASTAVAAWLLALNPLLASAAWGAVAYLLIRTLRLVITPWWWWSIARSVLEDWPGARLAARARFLLVLAIVGGFASLDVMIAVRMIRQGPPEIEPVVESRIEAMVAALDAHDFDAGVVADPRVSYALRARRGGTWPLVPAAHSNPEDTGLEERLAAFRRLHAAEIDSASWFRAMERLDGRALIVHTEPRQLAPYDEFGWIPSSDAARRLARRLRILGAVPVARGDAWSLHWAPERWKQGAAVLDSIPRRAVEVDDALAMASRFEVVGVTLDTLRVEAGATVACELLLRSRPGPDRTLHPQWEDVALRWRGPSPEIPDFARSFDKLYRKVVVERSARSRARFAIRRVPFEGTWPASDWPEAEGVIDRFTMRVPPGLSPGRYVIELSVQEKPWRDRRTLRDVLRDDDRYSGPVVATVDVVAPEAP